MHSVEQDTKRGSVILIFLKEGVKIEGNMPAAFLKCVRTGGRVRTKKLKGGKYIHICFKGGKSYSGEVKKKKK